jgi:hypothetical protein
MRRVLPNRLDRVERAPYLRWRPAGQHPHASLRGVGIWPVALGLVVLVGIAFWPVLDNGFVWDDDLNFLENPDFRGLGWQHFLWAWTTTLYSVWQPLAWLIFEAEFDAFELRPWGYHLTSIILHSLNAVVLYGLTLMLLHRCQPDWRPAGRCAPYLLPGLPVALFAVHPLRVEVVAWASCQPYLPCALFAMLAIAAYLKAHPGRPAMRPASGWLVGSILLFALSLLCKAASMGVALVLVILDIYPLGRLGGLAGWTGRAAGRVWLEKVPFAVLVLLCAIVAGYARFRYKETGASLPDRLSARLSRPCYGAALYIRETAWPAAAEPYRLAPGPEDLTSEPYRSCAIGVVAVSVGLLVLRRRWPSGLAAWAAYLAMLAPVAGLVRPGPEIIAADRYTYFATTVWVVLAAAGFTAIGRRVGWPAVAAIALVCVVAIGSLTVWTRQQCEVWRDAYTFWGTAMARGADQSATAHTNLGVALARRGRIEQAKTHFIAAVKLEPDNAMAHNDLGWVYRRQGQFASAIAEYNEALRLEPGLQIARRGLALARAGRAAEP